MVSNAKKIDKNCIVSFNRAKTDVYGLIDANKKQTQMINQLREEKNKIVVRVNELQQILSDMKDMIIVNQNSISSLESQNDMDSINTMIKDNYERITEVWEYAESVKATVTRLNTSMKKIKKTQAKLVKEVSKIVSSSVAK